MYYLVLRMLPGCPVACRRPGYGKRHCGYLSRIFREVLSQAQMRTTQGNRSSFRQILRLCAPLNPSGPPSNRCFPTGRHILQTLVSLSASEIMHSHVTRYVVAHGLDGNITDTQSDHRLHFHFVGRTAGMYRPHHGMFRSVTLLIKALGSHDD
jgi:hypothetical protein